ncbi:Poly(A) polymerase alpha [Blattella germanica]|nr:Poly(A) polymerase alpha [Blattella germanica]
MLASQTHLSKKAVSLAGPKNLDHMRTLELQEELIHHNVFETEEDHSQRMEILRKLNSLFKEWTCRISLNYNMPQNVAEEVGGKVFYCGSFRIHAHHKGADIDAVCVAPRHVNRSEYFTSFLEFLKMQKEVTNIRAVEKVLKVPLIKMKFDDVKIDLLFASLNLDKIDDTLELTDDMLLKNLDERCAKSMDGCRVANELLVLVPNIGNFGLALRAVKLWAKRRRLYNSVIGYLSGSSLAILMARTCQLYPNAIASTLVHKFFLVFSQWKWPQAVVLRDKVDWGLGLPVWNPWIHQLLVNLGKNPVIKLAHINPEYVSSKPDEWCEKWFIGLMLDRKAMNAHFDLTCDFQHFSDIVYRRARLLEILKDGMKIDLRLVKRRQLSAYLPQELVTRRKISKLQSSHRC